MIPSSPHPLSTVVKPAMTTAKILWITFSLTRIASLSTSDPLTEDVWALARSERDQLPHVRAKVVGLLPEPTGRNARHN
jgi:hypothetical protein